ncbi:hypothetical protein ACFV3E_45520 [Streptomyces sp. NPDC059718]
MTTATGRGLPRSLSHAVDSALELSVSKRSVAGPEMFTFPRLSKHTAPSEDLRMRTITVRDHDTGVASLYVADMPYPDASDNDVIGQVHAAGYTSGKLDRSATWVDRAGRDRTPSVPGHELSVGTVRPLSDIPSLATGARPARRSSGSRKTESGDPS